jgi:superfamily II DNA or RNA helicase
MHTHPHVRQRVKRLFKSTEGQYSRIVIKHTPAVAVDLEWLLDRYPMHMTEGAEYALRKSARAHEAMMDLATQAATDAHPGNIECMAKAPRPYQLQAIHTAMLRGGLLLADWLGLGKTVSAIGVIVQKLPALVVVQTHIQIQWKDKLAEFAPHLRVHIIEKKKEYTLPPHDVAIVSYSKLVDWADRYPWKLVVYDEIQELRHSTTNKHRAAMHLRNNVVEMAMGLSHSPVYNYGNEIFSVMETLFPGELGSWGEFLSEWCIQGDQHHKVEDPDALGAWLYENKMMLRRTRQDVGRELPPIQRIPEWLEYDMHVLERMAGQADALAKEVLTASFTEKGQAARKLDSILRLATGIAKAKQVAGFVAELVRNGEGVLLAGWHREVYAIWEREFKAAGIRCALYTGTESPAAKVRNAKAYIAGEIDVLMISLRSGTGLDGLQTRGGVVVIGEMDWSPKVVDQIVGRFHRDGMGDDPLTVFYLMIAAGSDPIVAMVNGVKMAQADHITDPGQGIEMQSNLADVADNNAVTLAREWLARHKKK